MHQVNSFDNSDREFQGNWGSRDGCSSDPSNISHSYTLLMCTQPLSRVQLCETPWTVARQAPLSMGFPRQEYWSGVPLPPPGDPPDPKDRTCNSCISCVGSAIADGSISFFSHPYSLMWKASEMEECDTPSHNVPFTCSPSDDLDFQPFGVGSHLEWQCSPAYLSVVSPCNPRWRQMKAMPINYLLFRSFLLPLLQLQL